MSKQDELRKLFIETFGFEPQTLRDETTAVANLVSLNDARLSALDAQTLSQLSAISNSGILSSLFPEHQITITPTLNNDEVTIATIPGFHPMVMASRLLAPCPVGAVVLPRPQAGFVEFVGARGTTMQTATPPSVTFWSRQKWSAYTVKAAGVPLGGGEYTYTDSDGKLIINDYTLYPVGTAFTIEGTPAGHWTVSVLAKVENIDAPFSTLIAAPGFTRYPDRSLREAGGVPFDHVQIGAVYDLDATSGLILTRQIDRSVAQFHGNAGQVSYIDTHAHTGFPADGPPVVQVSKIVMAETVSAYKAIARNAAGLGVAFDATDPVKTTYIGVTIFDALIGEETSVQYGGPISNPAWAWTISSALPYVYVATSGTLTQTPPSGITDVVQRIGHVKSATEIILTPSLRVDLTEAASAPELLTWDATAKEIRRIAAANGSVVRMGGMLFVDTIYGDDATGLRNYLNRPFATLPAALSAAISGDEVLLEPGTHTLLSPLALPNNINIRGVNLKSCKIQMTGVVANTEMITMGESVRLEDVTIELMSNNHVDLVGVKWGGTTSLTSKLRTAVVNVDNTGAGVGTSKVVGMLVQSTGIAGAEVRAVRAVTVTAKSVSSGVKRGVLMDTSVGVFNMSEVNSRSVGGSDSIGAEINIVGGTLGLDSGSFQGDTADWSQTAGTLRVNFAKPVNMNANAKDFLADATTSQFIWGLQGSVPGNATRYLYPGVTSALSASEIFMPMFRKCIMQRFVVNLATAPGAGKTDTFTIRKNGADTGLTVSISNTSLTGSTSGISVSFAAGDTYSLKVVGAIATGSSNPTLSAEVY
jgi:hypothetical protein